MFAHKSISELAGFTSPDALSVMQSRHELLRSGVYIGNCRYYGLTDVVRAVLLRRLRNMDVAYSSAIAFIKGLNDDKLDDAVAAFEQGHEDKLSVAFMSNQGDFATSINKQCNQADTSLIIDVSHELRALLATGKDQHD